MNVQSEILSLLQKLSTIANNNGDEFDPLIITSSITRRGLIFELEVKESADGNAFLQVNANNLEELLTKANRELEGSCKAWGYAYSA